ncbi:MAG TPA: hypothetical protein VNV42_01935 [Solirubrobacteraceae bacterium]|jgi:hypothetical protein|nr:hypothetical protein [Solirubrobacteraceae bacterium]
MHSLKSIYRSALRSNRRTTWWLTALLGAIALSLSSPVFAAAETTPASTPSAGSNPNDYECQGQLSAGKYEGEGTPEGSPIQYLFKCDGQITGYQVQTQVPITGIEGQPAVTNYQNQPLPEAFSCSGAFPGYAVNCVGATTKEAYERITGQFEIGWKLCTEPRVDALLTVTYAYLEKGVITQAIAGPFDLGRPEGCPSTPRSGKDRLDAFQGSEPKAKKHKHNKAGKGKKKGKAAPQAKGKGAPKK